MAQLGERGIDAVHAQAGRLAALDVLINNWDRWPLPIWQKNARFFAMDAEELVRAFLPLRPAGTVPIEQGGGSQDSNPATDILLECGANLGN
eukprot:4938338-Prymnesium_polylepis.1